MPRVACEELAFPVEAPAIAAEPSVTRHDAMTGNDDRSGIRSTRLRDRANTLRRLDRLRDGRIRARLAARNSLSPAIWRDGLYADCSEDDVALWGRVFWAAKAESLRTPEAVRVEMTC